MKNTVLLLCAAVCPAFAVHRDFLFEDNRGQAGAFVQFLGRGQGVSIAFSAEGVTFPSKSGQPLVLHFPGQEVPSHWEPLDELASKSSYFIGNDPAAWIQNVPHHRRLIRRGIYPGIDLIFYGNQERIEFDFVLAPHADPHRIRIGWTGAERKWLNATGDLAVQAGSRTLVCGKPALFQQDASGRVHIPGSFVLDAAADDVRFEVGPHDPNLSLTIDPTLDVVAFLGGTGNDRVTTMLGSIVAGVTDSSNLVGFGGRSSGTDIFTWDGQLYTVYGGTGDEEPTSMALTGNSLVVAGWTASRDFPLLGARSFQREFGGGATDGFVIVRPGPGANGYSSYLGGSGDDRILAIAADPSSPAADISGFFLAGETSSNDFPTLLALQPALGGGKDGFITRIGPTGMIAESTYWGGSGDDAILALDTTATACWFAGRTNSPDLRLAVPLQATLAGKTDAFLARLNITGAQSTLDFATYFGGSGDDEIRSLKIGPDSWIWTGGNTTSPDLPLTRPSQPSLAGDSDAWVARFNPVQAAPSFVTYFGGSGHDELTAIAHDGNGDLYAAGFTNSTDLPVQDALQYQPGGGDDGFIARFDQSGQPLMSTYAGGAGNDRLRALQVSSSQTITAAGESDSHDLPALTPVSAGSANAPVNAGQFDGLFLKFHQDGIYASGLTVGKDLTAELIVNIVSPDAAALPVTVLSTDSSRVTVNGGVFSTAAKFHISALAADGAVDLIVSAPGLVPRHVPVTLRPSYLVNPYSSPLQVVLNQSLYLNFRFATTHPDSGELIYQTVSADPSFSLVSGATEVVQSSSNFIANSPALSATLQGVGAGSASVAIVSPVVPIRGPQQLSVRVGPPGGPVLQPPNVVVGLGLQTTLPLPLSPQSSSIRSPFAVKLTSEDPLKLLLNAKSLGAGAESITLQYVPNSGTDPFIYLQGQTSSGVVRIRIEVDGSDPVFANVALMPSIVALATPLESSNSYYAVHHNPDVTSAVIDIWSTRNAFAIVAQIDGIPPPGFSIREQALGPNGPNFVNIESSDLSVVRATGFYGFGQGLAYSLVGFGLVKAGTASLTLTASGYKASPPLRVTVRPKDLPISVSNLVLGNGLETKVSFDPVYDFPPNLKVTITSSDPSRVLVSANQFDEGPVATGSAFWVSALASSGDVTVTIASPGYTSRSLIVHLVPTSFRLGPSKLTTTIGDYARLIVSFTYPNAPTGYVETYVRQKSNFTFAVAVANPSILRNDSSTVVVGYTGYTNLTAVNEGTTTVTLTSTSAAIVDPQAATATVVVTPRSFAFGEPTIVLGKDLQRLLAGIPYAANSGAVTLKSLDPSRLLLSAQPDVPGGETLAGNTPQIYLQALADSGDAIVVAKAPGYYDALLKVRLVPTAIGLFDPSSAYSVGGVGSNLTLRVAPILIDPASGNPMMLSDVSFRAGLDPFAVQLLSSNPSVGRIISPIALIGGLRENTTQFRADAIGTTEISVVPPPGFADGGAPLRRSIRVAAPRLVLADATIGKDIQYYARVSVSGASASDFNPGFIAVTSSDPARLLVSASPLSIGAAAVSVPSSNGSTLFYAQALASSGDVTLTATALGFDPVTATFHLEPSYFAFDGVIPHNDRVPHNSTFRPAIRLTHPSSAFPPNDYLRPGIGPITVPVDSSNPGVLSLQAPVVVASGSSQVAAAFFANAEGTATLHIGAPDGFSLAPDAQRTDEVSVKLRSFYLAGTYVGKDRSAALNYTAQSLERPVTIHFVSSDPTLVTLSTDPKAQGSAELTVDLAPGSAQTPVFVYGLASSGAASVSATALGFDPANAPVNVSPSTFSFGNLSRINLAAGGSATVRVVTADGQRVRGGIAPITVMIDNSNPITLQTSPAVFQPGDSYQDITVTAKAPGTAILTIHNDSGASNSSVLVVAVAPN